MIIILISLIYKHHFLKNTKRKVEVMTSTATKFKSSTTDTAKLAFNAQLVMHDEKQKQLKQSRRFGTLSIETHTQSVKFRYPKTNPMFHRSFKQPWKCILGKQVMEIYASNRVHSFRCRIVSKDEVEQVVDALCSIGVDIVDVDPEKYLFTDDTTIKSNEEADMAG